jgi:hypothetical protein
LFSTPPRKNEPNGTPSPRRPGGVRRGASQARRQERESRSLGAGFGLVPGVWPLAESVNKMRRWSGTWRCGDSHRIRGSPRGRGQPRLSCVSPSGSLRRPSEARLILKSLLGVPPAAAPRAILRRRFAAQNPQRHSRFRRFAAHLPGSCEKMVGQARNRNRALIARDL